MNIKQIKSLADILKESDLSVLDISEGELHIHLERGTAAAPAAVAPAAPAAGLTETAPAESLLPEDRSSELDFNDAKDIKAPMVGVFYSAPSPGATPYVSIGSKVKKGDVLCIIEAMKLMNEITSDFDGEIVDICAMDGDVVEYGQPLFKIC
ncbi:acetyl-CoA carboxylase biotin carboxyl carrier protein [Christensenellaceae bacterium NSJ-63]|uniref:Biotin carboxyl carrier protein of acetyl-CoA carboxylase n=1 Tax=Guopingia tenuis TaxID=2763656 RepID=A0A926HT01_9FIRM|nr:acetyl-CoA carboxylase biotin carboxyl carrier protein [Guopingia tenuis]MBC8538997.1 acetyl-CoA carboxylase biotin carboxyl carrier protein [Guopingia tenuis]